MTKNIKHAASFAVLLIFTLTSAIGLPYEPSQKRSGASDVAAPPSETQTLITKEEYDDMLGAAKHDMLVGGILLGIGVATITGGQLALYLTKEENKGLFDPPMRPILITIFTVVPGVVFTGYGIVSLAKGIAKKGQVEKKYRYSFSPHFDPQRGAYGLSYSLQF